LERRAGLYGLFADGNERFGFALDGDSSRSISWTDPCEFLSVKYDEPLEQVHARRSAFGGSHIRLDDTAVLELPGRYLVVQDLSSDTKLYQRGNIRVEWLLSGVFEVPAFCVGLATGARCQVEFGFGDERIKVLKAALTLCPKALDVVGVTTEDHSLCGAFEFGTSLENNRYLGHFIGLSYSGRELQPGDLLHGHYESKIGETQLTAQRALLRVVDVGSPHVPPLALPAS